MSGGRQIPSRKLGFQPDLADMLPACRYRNQRRARVLVVRDRQDAYLPNTVRTHHGESSTGLALDTGATKIHLRFFALRVFNSAI